MERHKTGCNSCKRRVCCCPRRRPPPAPPFQSSCICPPGPQGPRGFQGVPGPPGSTIILPGGESVFIEKFFGLLPLAVAVTLPAATAAGPGTDIFACTYLADAPLPGERTVVVGGAIINVAPNYPATPDGITFDAISATLQSTAGLTLPAGVQVVVQLVENAGRVGENVCDLEVVFGSPAGLVIPAIGVGAPLPTQSEEGFCFIESGNTYDVRVCLQNTTFLPIPIGFAAAASLQAAVTLRGTSA